MSELASNNPFRDRSGSTPRTSSPPPYTSVSKNPFLDANTGMHSRASKARNETDSSNPNGERSLSKRRDTPRSMNDDGEQSRRKDPSTHRSAGDNGARVHRLDRPTRSSGSTTHTKRPNRPRSNSETSAAELKKERSDRERRRERSDKDRPSNSSKPRKHLDKIDLLDVTGFAAAGGFHHDGPFDACTPHRNKNAKKAPVLAFAKDSTAMTMAAGPPTQPVYFGDHVNNVESFSDYGNLGGQTRPGAGARAASFNPTSNIDQIHGYESVGLGTTTFLEGAPASRSAMLARTVSDNGGRSNELRPRATSDHAAGGSGLGRKKSVLQKIRGAYRDRAAESQDFPIAASPPSSPYKQKDKDAGYFEDPKDYKGAANITFQVTEEDSSNHLSPLYRPSSNGGASATNGLIKRVKSLRVSGKKRPE